MKRNLSFSLMACGAFVAALVGSASAQTPQPKPNQQAEPRSLDQPSTAQALLGTAFTYQGQLKQDGSSVNATCDFSFELFDNGAAGTQIGAAINQSLAVASGIFVTQLDFGGEAFTGEARWLEIAVGCPTGTALTTLSPRQALTPSPYALALPGMRTQQNLFSPNVIGGYKGNTVTAGVHGAAIGGGGEAVLINRVTDDYGTVSGGEVNRAGDDAGTTSDKSFATVGGGGLNIASGQFATIAGGFTNVASGYAATVPGGANNTASANYSLAAGYRAQADHVGAFVWADSTNANYASTARDQFAIRASNGVSLAVNAGNSKAIHIGERYRDNSIVAWAKINANGTVEGTAEFGISQVAHDGGPGVYSIGIDGSALSASHLIPIAVAEVDSAPNSAAAARIVTVNQIGPSAFRVFITDGNYNLVDNELVFMVTAR